MSAEHVTRPTGRVPVRSIQSRTERREVTAADLLPHTPRQRIAYLLSSDVSGRDFPIVDVRTFAVSASPASTLLFELIVVIQFAGVARRLGYRSLPVL
jgi:hypothetical protein